MFKHKMDEKENPCYKKIFTISLKLTATEG